MGHPADLEKLRFSLLEMAHVEGFNRSPSDVTGARLMKYGLAPTIKQAFEEIYNRHHRRVYSLCLRMLQNTAEAEDLTQEVFIQLYRKIGSFRGDSAFSTWLHRMTVNQVLMHFRKRGVKYEKTTEEGETPVQIVGGTENPNKMPIVDKIALENAIQQLPEGYKNVFVLHDVEGCLRTRTERLIVLAPTELNGERAALREHSGKTADELRRLQAQEQELRAVVDDQTAHLGRTYGEIERLGRLIQEMEGTRAWRLHRWWQRKA